jgi:hypothetical protein
MHTFSVRVAAIGVALGAVAGAAGAQSQPRQPAGEPPAVALTARNVAMQAPTARIYRSVGPDGSVVFGDRPAPGAQLVEIRSFPSSSEPAAAERARREREYWRAQAVAFEQRRIERERLAERDRMARAQNPTEEQWRVERDAWWDWYLTAPDVLRRAPPPPPRWSRRAAGGAGPGPAPGAWGPGSAPGPAMGAAAGVPAAFIGSGFATSR